MTIIDIQNQVFGMFFTTDIISVNKAVETLKFDTKDPLSAEEKKKLVQIALDTLKKLEIVESISEDKWIIRRNFLNDPQSVDVSSETASMLAGFVNTYRKVSGFEGGEVDVLNITDDDIQAVCSIGNLLLNLIANQGQIDKKD